MDTENNMEGEEKKTDHIAEGRDEAGAFRVTNAKMHVESFCFFPIDQTQFLSKMFSRTECAWCDVCLQINKNKLV